MNTQLETLKQELIDQVLDYITDAVHDGDLTSVEEMLTFVPTENLIGFLPEELWEKFNPLTNTAHINDEYIQLRTQSIYEVLCSNVIGNDVFFQSYVDGDNSRIYKVPIHVLESTPHSTINDGDDNDEPNLDPFEQYIIMTLNDYVDIY